MGETLQKAKIIGIAILALLVIVVVLQNTETVETQILFLKLEMPRAALLFGTLVIGFALGVLMANRMLSKKKAAQS